MSERTTVPKSVTIVEVGPRDGLQNESTPVSTEAKIAFINALARAGLKVIEATSFVNPAAVPQMADAAEVMAGIDRLEGVRYPVLVPNIKGYERAREAGVDAIALFAAATEAFSKANLRSSIDESFVRFQAVAEQAKRDGVWLRGYVSVAFHCPFSGPVDAAAAIAVAERLLGLGCDEICFADTIGRAVPEEVERLLAALPASMPPSEIALHLHDTTGRAIDNVATAYALGVRIFDSAAGGLGGCPFAPGAPGNVATEAVVGYFEDRGIHTGVDIDAVKGAVQTLGIIRNTSLLPDAR